MRKSLATCLVGLAVIFLTALVPPSSAATAAANFIAVDEATCGQEAGCTFCSGEQCTQEGGGTVTNCHYACGGAHC